MRSIKFTSWQEEYIFIGFLNEYPDYQSQGMTKEELVENLKGLIIDIESGQVPYMRKVEELLVRRKKTRFNKIGLCVCA